MPEKKLNEVTFTTKFSKEKKSSTKLKKKLINL